MLNMRHDIIPVFLQADGFQSEEACGNGWLAGKRKEQRASVMLREPRAHIYSLYTMTCCSWWGRKERGHAEFPQLDNVTAWLTWFLKSNMTWGGTRASKDPKIFFTYHPLNFQARHFTCLSDPHQVTLPEPSIDSVLESFRHNYEFVGILERYQESVCLFTSMASGKLPAYCDCDDPESWSTFPDRHEKFDVPHHHITDLTSNDIKMIDALTSKDAVLYAEGVRRFIKDIDLAEQKHGQRILCDRDILPRES